MIFIIIGDYGIELYCSNEIVVYKVFVIIYLLLLKKMGVFLVVLIYFDFVFLILNLLCFGYFDDFLQFVLFIGQEFDMCFEFYVDCLLLFSSMFLKNCDVLFNGKVMLYGLVYLVGKDLQLIRVNNKKMQCNFMYQLELYNIFLCYVMVQDKIVLLLFRW